MIVLLWLTLSDGADRIYASTTPPSRERYRLLKEQGAEIFRVEVSVLDWEVEDGKIHAIAMPVNYE